jgi:hypothetical protein
MSCWCEGLTWQLPGVAEDGDGNEEGHGPSAQEANPPGTNPERALSGQLCPVQRGSGLQSSSAYPCPSQ